MAKCEMCLWDPARKVRATWLITAQAALPSQNMIGSNGKGPSGQKYRKWRTKLQKVLEAQLNEIPRAKKFRAAVITRYYSGNFRAYDHENFVGGCKPLVDVLRGFDVIVNDNKSYWRGYYRQLPSTTGEVYFTIELYEYAD